MTGQNYLSFYFDREFVGDLLEEDSIERSKGKS